MCKLTIITINYNNASGLRKTIESVLSQSFCNFEYILVNSISTQHHEIGKLTEDVEVLKYYIKEKFSTENGFTRCIWSFNKGDVCGGFYSEPDNGIYHAMNKGIKVAKGEYVHFLNSGDWLVDEFVVEKMLNKLSNLINSGQKPDVFVGNKISVRPDGRVRYDKSVKQYVTAFTFYRGTIEHTSAYIRRAMFDEVGLYDENLKIVSDWKWYFMAIGLRKANVNFIDYYVSCFDTTGISSSNKELELKERRQVLEDLLPYGIIQDYDRYSFDIVQMERLKRYPLIYNTVWFVERLLFKWDKYLEKKKWR